MIRFFELENFIDVIYDDNPQVNFLNFGINKIKVLNSKKMYKQNNYKLIILLHIHSINKPSIFPAVIWRLSRN